MIKFKTRKSLKKRLITTSGGLKRGNANTSHLFGNKTSRQKKSSRKVSFLNKSDLKRVRKIIYHKDA